MLDNNVYQAEIGALCAVNTFLASSGGCIAALMIKCFTHYRETGETAFDLVAAMNGTLTGLVAVRVPTYPCFALTPDDNSLPISIVFLL